MTDSVAVPGLCNGSRSSACLRMKLALLQRDHTAQRFWGRRDLSEIFPEFLFLTHCIIRASVPLMQAAVNAAQTLASCDPVARELVSYFNHHVTEEQSHDEWLLDDMKILGLSRSDVLRRIPSPSVAEVVGAQYYWIRHAHPVALLGYVAVLEGDPPCEEELQAAALRSGLPPEAFRTFLSHARLDPHHKEELNEFIDSLPLTPEQESLMGVSAIATYSGLQRAFDLLSAQK